MKHYRVAIIGGGLAGCSAALHVSRRGAKAALFERGRCGAQASGVNFGGVRQQGRHFAEMPLARRSRTIWGGLRELVGSDCEFVASGHLKLAFSDKEMAELEAYRATAKDHGLDLELVGSEKIRDRYPYLGTTVFGGSICHEDGQANPRLVAPAFARAARRAGADIFENAAVTRAWHDGDRFIVEAGGERMTADRLINTAGAWGSRVASWFGDNVDEDVMAPNMCVTEPLPFFMTPALGVCGGGIYLRQTPHGSVVFGSGLGVADRDRLRARPLPAVTEEGARKAIELVPRLKNALLVRTWTGIEGRMADGLPVLGQSPLVKGLYHAFGFTGHGFQLGPAVGAVLSEFVLDGDSVTDVSGLSVDRMVNERVKQHPSRTQHTIA